jgi:hypothetical protein
MFAILALLVLAVPQSFDAAEIVPMAGTERPAGLGDLDEDGQLDLITYTNMELHVLLGDGAGGFVPQPGSVILGTYNQNHRRPAGVGDVDADGHLDVVVTGTPTTQTTELQLVRGHGDGTFRAAQSCFSGGFPNAPAVVLQWDADPELEAAWVSSQVGGAILQLFDYDGSCLAHAADSAPNPDTYITTIFGADLDGDGRDELVLHDQWFHRAFVMQDVGGVPTITATYAVPQPLGTGFSALAVGDLEGDGDIDIVATHLHEEPFVGAFLSLTLLANDGTGVLAAAPTTSLPFPNGDTIYGPVFDVADWDGDGLGDLVGKPDVWPNGIGVGNGMLALFRHAGGGVFEGPGLWPDLSMTRIGGAADLDGDGLPELVSKVVVRSEGAFENRIASPFYGFSPSHLVYDVDRDGDVDILPSQLMGPASGYWSNDGTGAQEPLLVAPDLTLAQDQYLLDKAHGDFDADGRHDIIMELWEIQGAFQLDAFLGLRRLTDAGGTGYVDMGPAADSAHAWLGEPRFTADIDGDGNLDVPDEGSVWYGDGTGQLAPPVMLFPDGTILAAGDVEPDGDPDLLVLHQTPGGLETRLQRNTGSGYQAELLATDSSIWSRPGLLDLDGDGDLDAVLPRDLGSGLPAEDILIFENDGASLVQVAAVEVVLFAAVSHLAVDDVDGDGLRDLLALSNGIGDDAVWARLTVLRRNGPGVGYDAARSYVIPQGSGLADGDADGDVDVLGGVLTANMRVAPPAGGSVRQYGQGSAGTGGAVPLLGATGPLAQGSPTASVRLVRGVGNAVAYVVIGSLEASLPGAPKPSTTFYVGDPLVFLPVPLGATSGAAGLGELLAPFPVDPVLAGSRAYVQAFVLDPGAAHSVAASNGLEVVFAP